MLKIKLFNRDYLNEIDKLFQENLKYFPEYTNILDFIEDCQGHFYIVLCDDKFTGCLFLDKWTKDSVYIGGFSIRKNINTLKSFNLLVYFIFKDYPFIKTIFSNTKFKHVRFFLKKAGFQKINNNLYKKERQNNGKI